MINEVVLCPDCSSPMKMRLAARGANQGKYFWGCSRYPRCKGIRNIETSVNSKNQSNPIFPQTLKEVVIKKKKKQFNAMPYSKGFDVFFTQSCSLPKEVFDEYLFGDLKKENIEKFASFRMDILSPQFKVNQNMLPIYSLGLRLLNRGIITLNSKDVEMKLKNIFNCHVNDFSIEIIDNYIIYNKPLFNVDSDRERFFIDNYLSKWLGSNWASHLMTQVSLDSIIDSHEGSGQRVDFLIVKDGVNLVIELDGPEHEEHQEKDATRDSLLMANGYQVIRVKNEELNNPNSASLVKVKEAIGNTITRRNTTSDYDKYIVANKIIHQVQIAILKALELGYINDDDNLSILLDSAFFTYDESNKIMEIALKDLHELINNFCKLYKVENSFKCQVGNEDTICIAFGNGVKDQRQIIIRDIAINQNLINEIGTFKDLMIGDVDENVLRYFLKLVFRFDDFQEGQLNAVQRVLNKKDTIVLLPTGSGKSLIYQLTSLLVPGQTIVVSPIVSLMDDQVENLKYFGIDNCVAIYADIDRDTTQNKLSQMKNNENILTYLSPERLQIGSFRDEVKALLINNRVYTVAIDEAHCVSEWGHSFRTAYLNIGKNSRTILRKGQDIPVIVALTGTASTAVLKDVKRELQITEYDAIITPRTFDRPELKFEILESTSEGKFNVLSHLISNTVSSRFNISRQRFLELNKEDTYSGIIFCPHTNGQFGTSHISSELKKNTGLKVESYSGQPPKSISPMVWANEKKYVAENFKRNHLNLLVATKSYGMGIDKSNIRYIVHYGIPGSIEAYYQEAGRAGRDKRKSVCTILFSNDNNNEKILDATISLEEVHEYVNSISFTQNDDISRMLYFHKEAFQGIETEMDYARRVLKVIFEHGYTPLRRHYALVANKQNRNNYEKAIQRLVILGVLDDYTVDYSSNEYQLALQNFSKSGIVERYCEYVRGYNEGRVKVEKLKLVSRIDLDIESFVEFSVKTIVEFVYDTIEKGRRRALKEIVQMSKAALGFEKLEDQDKEIRTRIVRYFESSYSEILNEILESEDLGFKKIKEIFDGCTNDDGEQIGGIRSHTESEELRGQVSRFLESTPDYPSLLFLRSLTECYTKEYNQSAVVDDFVAAIKFTKDRYSVSNEELNKVVVYSLSKVFERNADLFVILLKVAQSYLGESINQTIMQSDNINDQIRIIPFIEYINLQNSKVLNIISEMKG